MTDPQGNSTPGDPTHGSPTAPGSPVPQVTPSVSPSVVPIIGTVSLTRPTLRQALLILGGGFFVAAFGCAGFLSGMGSNFTATGTSELGAILFVLGMLAFLLGGVLLLIVAIRAVFGGRTTTPTKPPTPAAPR